ncbi:MAG: zinc-ribbon domain-containing protein [Candidatus Coproplasma sp.]
MFCKNCGKEIDDNADVCIYCGKKVDKTVGGERKVNGFGIAGFVIALLSLWLGTFYCIAPIVGLVLSIVGMSMSKKCNSCNGLAIAGLVISIISLVVWVIIWLVVGVAILSVLA